MSKRYHQDPLGNLPESLRERLRESAEEHREITLAPDVRDRVMSAAHRSKKGSASQTSKSRIAWALAALLLGVSLTGAGFVWALRGENLADLSKAVQQAIPAQTREQVRQALRLRLQFPPLWKLGPAPMRWASQSILHWSGPSLRDAVPNKRLTAPEIKMPPAAERTIPVNASAKAAKDAREQNEIAATSLPLSRLPSLKPTAAASRTTRRSSYSRPPMSFSRPKLTRLPKAPMPSPYKGKLP